jgi:methylated-DNA-[protein]-cysteine S-methyltransferase
MKEKQSVLWINKADIQAQTIAPVTVAPVETPLGVMMLVERNRTLSELRLNGEIFDGEKMGQTPLLVDAARELTEYFAGKRTTFSVPLAAIGTPFQLTVWHALIAVPYGQTVSYGELARNSDRPAAARAVGMANHANPLPIFIPCHRVIGANGKLVGYGGGLDKKEALLKLEAEHR